MSWVQNPLNDSSLQCSPRCRSWLVVPSPDGDVIVGFVNSEHCETMFLYDCIKVSMLVQKELHATKILGPCDQLGV